MATAGRLVFEGKIAIDIILAEDGKYYVDSTTTMFQVGCLNSLPRYRRQSCRTIMASEADDDLALCRRSPDLHTAAPKVLPRANWERQPCALANS
jgi:hypothetical protein